MGKIGLVSGVGPAAPPYRHGPYKWDQHVTFTQGMSGVSNGGNIWYVDSTVTASGNGESWTEAFATITEAVTASSEYDTILVKGTDNQDSDSNPENDYAESVTIPATKMGLRIIGMGNRPEGIKWTVGAQDEICLTINAIDCHVEGFRFRTNGATSSAGIYLAANVDLSANANGATIRNCIFRSTTETALAGIWTEGASDVLVEDCVFTSVVTGILQTATPAHVTYRMTIRNNFFDDKCTNGIKISGRSCLIENNRFAGAYLTTIIDTITCSAQGSYNVVRGHWFVVATAFETNCVGSTTDDWNGNFCSDTGSSVVEATNQKYMVFGYPQS